MVREQEEDALLARLERPGLAHAALLRRHRQRGRSGFAAGIARERDKRLMQRGERRRAADVVGRKREVFVRATLGLFRGELDEPARAERNLADLEFVFVRRERE